MKLDSLTDIGIKRKENQDNYWGALLSVDGEEAGVVCLCDGMGGLNNGGLASRIVVEAVRDYLLSSFDWKGISEVLKSTNQTVYNLALSENIKMGTTCTVLICYQGIYRVFHIGDTRCYLLREHEFNSVTTDHSALKKYKVTKQDDEALWRKYKNLLTKCIGIKPEIEVDYYEGTYNSGDVFFLCSDGLWHYLDEVVFTEEELFNLKDLVTKCINNGETDNITAGLLEV